jgi:peptide/nickel transport system permease protein
MTGYVAGRILQLVPTLALTSSGMFVLLRLVPGDPAVALAGPDATSESINAIRQNLGLDQPLPLQYLNWLQHLVTGNLGNSILARRPVSDLLGQALPATVELLVAAMITAVLVGGALGIFGAVYHGRWPDTLVGATNALLIGVPGFWLGLLAIILFALVLGWLPPGGRVDPLQDTGLAIRTLILPALVLGLGQAAVIARFTRGAILEVLAEAYVLTARSKGLRNSIVLTRHALPNALIPVVTIIGIHMGHLLGGAVVIETVFAWPGVGRLAVNAISGRDYPVVQAVVLMLVTAFLVLNLATDLLYGYLDPRVRAGAG